MQKQKANTKKETQIYSPPKKKNTEMRNNCANLENQKRAAKNKYQTPKKEIKDRTTNKVTD